MPSPTRCVCPGSFDPPTLGHVDVVTRAAALFDEVVVAVHVNPAKTPHWSARQRVEALRECLDEALPPHDAARVRVEAVEGGLLVDHVRSVGATAVVKGLRSPTDVEHEQPMAVVNRDLAGVETVLLVADPRWGHVSSSLVRQVHLLGGSVVPYVPPAVLRRLQQPATAEEPDRRAGWGHGPPPGSLDPRSVGCSCASSAVSGPGRGREAEAEGR